MKRIALLFLTTLTLGFSLTPTYAQNTLTVANGTGTNSYVPFNGYYLDMPEHTQIIYPASMLTDMIGKDITKMEFYTASTPVQLTAILTVYLGITTASQFPSAAFDNNTVLEHVYTGNIVIVNNVLSIEFSTPFSYTGGNLLFDLSNTTGNYAHVDFYGITQQNASLNQYFDWYPNPDRYDFLPKATFTYETPTLCPKANTLTASNITANSATISWNGDPSVPTYRLQYMPASDTNWSNATSIQTTNTTANLTNLQYNTTYKARVQSLCSESLVTTSIQTLVFTTPNLPVTLPYMQDFETSPQLISEFIFTGTGVNQWAIGSATFKPMNAADPNEIGHSLYISEDNGTSNSYNESWESRAFAYFNVAFGNDPIEYHLSFDYKTMGEMTANSIYDYLSVYLVDATTEIDPNNNPTGLALIGQQYNVANWTHVDFILSNVANTSKKVLFYWRNDVSMGNNPPAAIDNIMISGSACAQPNLLTASAITTNTATLLWNETGSATSWTLYYKAVSDAQFNSVSVSGTPSYTLSGLNADTYYTFYVEANCGSESSVPSVSYTFKTQCSELTAMPYSNNFDVATIEGGAEFIACWSRLASNPSQMVYYFNDANYTHNGSAGCLDFSYTPYCWTMAISPAISSSIPVNTLMLDFYLVKTGESGTFEVGVMTDPTDANTFQLVQTINSTIIGNNAASYEHHVVSLSSYNGNGQYIAFRAANAIDCGYRMDDLVISVMPSCMVPINLQCLNASTQAATLSWTEVGNAQSWQIRYGVTGFDPETEGTLVNANTNPFTVSGLQNITTYDFYVRSNCGNEQSEWSSPITVKTGTFNIGVVGSDTMLTCGAFIYDDGGEFGNHSAGCDYTLVIYPATEGNGIQISGSVHLYDAISYYMSTLTIYEGVGTTGNVLGFYTGVQDVNVAYGGPITLRFQSDEYEVYCRAGFELLVRCTDCFPPSNLAVSGITQTSATLSWNGNADHYAVYLNGPTSGYFTTTTSSYTFNNLASGSAYYVTVRGYCAQDSSLLSQPAYFATACGSITVTDDNPWTETFESYPGVGEQPFVCWDTPVTAVYGGPFVFCGYGEAAHSGANTAELTGYENLLVLPVFTNDVHDLRLSFWATGYGIEQTNVEVGVIADLQDLTTFEPVCNAGIPGPRGSAAGGNGYFMGPFDFNGVQATSGRIAIHFTSNYAADFAGWNMDDFTVSLAPDCPSPLKNSVEVGYVDGHSATITFTDNDTTHNAWVVYYKANSATTWSTMPTTSTTVVLNGLTPLTTYQVYIVTNCGTPQSEPDATNPIQFTTTVSCPAPVGITVTPGTTTAVVTWVGSADSYTVVCNEDTMTVTGTTATLTGLLPLTNYTVEITGHCGADGVSATGTAPFATVCDVVDIFPYATSFDNNDLGCWTEQTINGNNHWHTTTVNPHTGAACVYMSYTVNTSSRLISPIFDLSGHTNPMISFYQRRIGWQGVADSLVVFYRTSITSDWVRIAGYHDETYDYHFDSLALPSPSATYQVSFVGYGIDGYSIYLDDITLYDASGDAPGLCNKPTALTVSDINSTTAHVTWNPGGTETNWKLQYKKATTTNWGPEYSLTSPSYNFAGLQPSTPYHVRVKAICNDVDESDWTNLVSFTTAQSSVPIDPTVTTGGASNISQTYAVLNATITNPDNQTITSRGFEWKTTSGGTYAQVAASGTGNTYTYVLTDLDPSTSYTFKAYIIYNGNTIYGDELTFNTLDNETPSCDVPTGLHTTSIENHAITITWNADANVESWNIQYRVGTGTWSSATSATNSYTLNDLEGNTDYEIQVQANCGDDLSNWSSSITAHTTNVGIENWLENSVTLFPNPANEYINVECRMQNVEYSITDIQLFDVYGKMIWTNNHLSTPTRINVSGLAEGMYFVRVTTDKGTVTKTFVKKQK